MTLASGSITDVAGILVGHDWRLDSDARVASEETPGSGWASGTTVVLLPDGAVTAVDVRGGAPGTRETDLLNPSATVQVAHAICLSGGSAYGLAAADGVMAYLEEQGRGIAMDTRGHVVPIVPSAVIFDLPVGGWAQRPDRDFGYRAAAGAGTEVAEGSVGAGVGARAGRFKGGVGTASLTLTAGPAAGATVAALVVVNGFGELFDAAGVPWDRDADWPAPTAQQRVAYDALVAPSSALNTCIGVVATDAALDQAAAQRLAIAGQDGWARTFRPAHTVFDGDTLFAVATGTATVAPVPVPPGMAADTAVQAALGQAAATVVAHATLRGAIAAAPVAGIATVAETFPASAAALRNGAL